MESAKKISLSLFAANILWIVLALAIAEGAAQLVYRVQYGQWWPSKQRKAASIWEAKERTYHALFEADSLIGWRLKAGSRVSFKEITATTDAAGNRICSHGKVSGKAGILACYGGSTTFSAFVSDEDSWPFILQSYLPAYRIVNRGVPAYSSAEALMQLKRGRGDSAADIMLFYQGWNDLRNYHDPAFTADYSNYRKMASSMLLIGRQETLLGYSATYQLIKIWRGTSRGNSGKMKALKEEPDPRVDRAYSANLSKIERFCARENIRCFFIPQVLNEKAYRGPGSRLWTPYIQNEAVPRLNRHLADVMFHTLGRDSARVWMDVYDLRWEAADFVDDGHLSVQGNRKFADFVFRKLQHYLKESQSPKD